MAHREEILAAVLALRATASLREGVEVPWPDLESSFESDLSGTSDLKSKVRFPNERGERTATPVDWLAGLRHARATAVGLLPTPAPEHGPARIGGQPVEEHKLHAFAGTGGVVLAARAPSRLLRFRSRVWLPPPTTLRSADVLQFVAGRDVADDLRDALLWQDEHNLRVTDGKDWARFVAALRPEHDEGLVQALDRAVNNTRFARAEADAWIAFKRGHANPDCAWQLDFVPMPDGTGELPREPVGSRSERLRAALVEIEAYAREIGESFWAERFQKALALLAGGEVAAPIATWFAGTGMSDGAFRLLASGLHADVFGGMGSWNDLGPKDRERYDRVSARLFRELQPSLIGAVNETVVGARR